MGRFIIFGICAAFFSFSTLVYSAEPRIFIERTGAIGQTPRLIGVPAGWNYLPPPSNAQLASITTQGGIVQPATGISANISDRIPRTVLNTKINIKPESLKKALKKNFRRTGANPWLLLATFASFINDMGWYLNDEGILVVSGEDCDLKFKGYFNLSDSTGVNLTSSNNSNSTFSVTKTYFIREFQTKDDYYAAIQTTINDLNNVIFENITLSDESMSNCDNTNGFGCIRTFDFASGNNAPLATRCENSSSFQFPKTCELTQTVYFKNSAPKVPVSQIDYKTFAGFTSYSTNSISSPTPPYRSAGDPVTPVKYHLGEPVCAVVEIPVPLEEIDKAIDENNFIVTMVDLNKLQFNNEELLELEEDIIIEVDSFSPVETELPETVSVATDNLTGKSLQTTKTEKVSTSLLRNSSDYPALKYTVTDTSVVVDLETNETVDSSTNVDSFNPPTTPPLVGGGTGGGGTGGGGTGGGGTGGGGTGEGIGDLPAGEGCDIFPDFVCRFYESWFSDEGAPEDPNPDLGGFDEVFDDVFIDEIGNIDLNTYDMSFGSKTCPPPVTLNISFIGKQIEISYNFWCDLLERVSVLFMAVAYMLSVSIVMGSFNR